MTISDITTGVQTKTTTGPITGSLDTSALSGKYGAKVQFTLTAGQAEIALEDTANASAFSDAMPLAVFAVRGSTPLEGITLSKQDYEIATARFGAPNTKLRFNVLSISGGGTLTAHGWLEQ